MTAVASLIGAAPAATAEEQDFLFLLDEAYTQQRHELQLTSATQFTRGVGEELEIEDDGSIQESRQTTKRVRWPVEIEWGITDRLEAEVEMAWVYRHADATPLGTANRNTKRLEDFEDLELGLRYLVQAETEHRPAVSVAYGLQLPTGDKTEELGAENEGHELSLALSRDFGRWVAHANLGAGVHFNETRKNEDGTFSPKTDLRELTYGVAGVRRLTENWKVFLELFHEIEEEIEVNKRKSDTALTLLPGLSYAFETQGGGRDHEWEIGVGVPLGLTHDAADWGVTVQAKYEVRF